MGNVGHNFTDLSGEGKKEKERNAYQAVIGPHAIISRLLKGGPLESPLAKEMIWGKKNKASG